MLYTAGAVSQPSCREAHGCRREGVPALLRFHVNQSGVMCEKVMVPVTPTQFGDACSTGKTLKPVR